MGYLDAEEMEALHTGKPRKVKLKKDGTVDKRSLPDCKPFQRKSKAVTFLDENEIEQMKAWFLWKYEKSCADGSGRINRLTAFRNYSLFRCGINCGLRISDLSTLRWDDVVDGFGNPRDTISLKPKKTEKISKYVTVYCNDAFKKSIMELREVFFSYWMEYPEATDYVFASKKGSDPISKQRAWQVLKEAASGCGIQKNIGTHSMRKTFGRHWYINSKDKAHTMRLLQEAFKHASPFTTLTYIGITADELCEHYNSNNL